MPLINKDIHNILSIQFENISKYLKYDDYYVFYQLYAPKNINKLIRKCIYCNNIPVCPINICYKRYNIKKICNESLIRPICYTCAIDNWVHKYNKLSSAEYEKLSEEEKDVSNKNLRKIKLRQFMVGCFWFLGILAFTTISISNSDGSSGPIFTPQDA